MKRACKIVFHDGEADEKPIVTLYFAINNSKRFKNLSSYSKANLISLIDEFKGSLEGFKMQVVMENHKQNKNNDI